MTASTKITVPGLSGFELEPGTDEPDQDGWLVPPDAATCEACLRELFDPLDRRYHYPFISCAECGPRFSIMETLPYGRERTTMRAFPMCEACRGEYEDAADRRFHAEPVACPECGPRLSLVDGTWSAVEGDPIERAAAMLKDGAVLALKGLGGFHLSCDAQDDRVVCELRRRKDRPAAPFPVMVADLIVAHGLFVLSPAEAALLTSSRAPIVLVRDRGLLPETVAPGHRRQGVVLPSSPLHHLLLRAVDGPLVMTGGNLRSEPVCITEQEARRRLSGIADAFLIHDRKIASRCEDSVTKVHAEQTVVLRRSRGFAPTPIALLAEVRPTLGTGAGLHGAFCLAGGGEAILSQQVGDLDSDSAMTAYRQAFDRFRQLFEIEPEIVAHDLDPRFPTTAFAASMGLPAVPVQHHHAHIVAVMAEHQLEGRVIGVAFDGSGLGEEGTGWGGEFLVGDWGHAERAGHLRAVRQPGAEAAVRNPVRMALSHAMDAGVLKDALRLLGKDRSDERVALGQIESGVNAPLTTSAGRLFDAVAALTGVCRRATYEGQPAILLEQAAQSSATFEYPFDVGLDGGEIVLDTRPIIATVVKDLVKGRTREEVAGRFHRTMAAGIVAVCRLLRGRTGLDRVCLSGGVFQNDLLTADVAARLSACDFHVFAPRQVPIGDGGIALGQVLVAHARLEVA